MNIEAKCTCEWCQKFSPLYEKISFLLDDESEKKLFDEMIGNLMNAETDAVYWKEKYYGRWRGDGLQTRIKQIKNENQ